MSSMKKKKCVHLHTLIISSESPVMHHCHIKSEISKALPLGVIWPRSSLDLNSLPYYPCVFL